MKVKRKPARPAALLGAGVFTLACAVVALLNERPSWSIVLLSAMSAALIGAALRPPARRRPSRSAANANRSNDRREG